MRFLRSLHTTRAARAFKKAGSGSAQRISTPKKNSGEFRWFEDAAPYSKFHLKAPIVAEKDVEIVEPTGAENISELRSAQLVSWPASVLASLHHIGSFKPNQQNELFRQFVSVVRSESKTLWSDLLKQGNSALLTGDAGVGKTTLLAQAHAAAKSDGYAVLHISQVERLLDGSSNVIFNDKSGKWEQPMAVARLFKKAQKSNREIKLGETVPTTLAELVERFGSSKLLITADNINALNHFSCSANTDTENRKLYHNDLELVNTLLELLSSPKENICVIGATSGNYKPIDFEGYAYAPLTDFDPDLVSKFAKAKLLDVGRLTGAETKSFVDYLHAAQVTTKSWQELYQHGNGNPRSIMAVATNFAY